jgi:adenylate cyclase
MQHYAGSLTALTSEGFTALFGAPVAQEDHAQRAVQAALTLRERLHHHPDLGVRAGEGRLALQMGLHSGLVVGGWLGQDPQRRYTAVGAPMHLIRARISMGSP